MLNNQLSPWSPANWRPKWAASASAIQPPDAQPEKELQRQDMSWLGMETEFG